MANKCAFCMRLAKLSGEHLWSDWIGEILGETKFVFRKQLIGEPGVKEWESGKLDVTAKVVCESCNNNWMSDLEKNHAKPSMQRMILKADPVLLDASARASIAAFAFKTAVVGDHMFRDKPPFFPSDVRRRFAYSLSVPTAIYIWLGCVGMEDPHHGVFRMLYHNSPPGTVNGFRLYIFTWGVGRLVLQLVALRWTRARLRRKVIPDLTQTSMWDDYAIPVWPNKALSVEWPPLFHLSDDLLTEFSDRMKRVTAPAIRL